MGSCLSSKDVINVEKINQNNIGQATQEIEKVERVVTSSRKPNIATKTSRLAISVSDFLGIKKSDSIENFYEIEKIIGRGAFGEVAKATHIYTGETRAIKIIDKRKLQKHSILMQLQLSELNVLRKTDHPSLMKVFEIVEDDNHFYIISELLEGGELYERILKMQRFSEKDCGKMLFQILRGLNYMHKKFIVHRDIKPENILLESKNENNLELKITDFGFAKCYDPSEGNLTETLGSPLYMAPEIVKKLPYDCSVDIWALGILTYIMLCGKPPFKGKTKDEIFVQITTKNITFSGEIWKQVSKEARNFVKKMLIRDNKQRYTAEQLLQDDWLKLQIQTDEIENNVLIDITNNLKEFQKTTVFQSAVMTYILSQNDQRKDIKKLKKIFIQFDESGDGQLQLSEITKGLKQVLGSVKGSMKIFEEIMTSLDKNMNGVIDYTEFLTAASNKQDLLNEKNLNMAFQMFDTDHNGTISREELKTIFETSEKKEEELWTDIFLEVDINNDGEISFEEFKQCMHKVFENSSQKEQQQLGKPKASDMVTASTNAN